MSDQQPPDVDQLPLDLLVSLAGREVEEDDPDAQVLFLVALQQQPVREVFDIAAALLTDSVATKRALGVRILRELGAEQPDGRRPFSAETIPLLRRRLRDESNSGVLRWIVSALGYHRACEALPEVLALAEHPDARVRFHIAAGLPSLMNLSKPEPDAVRVLIRLCRDDDADIRYYALYAATREIEGLDAAVMTRLTGQLTSDPDGQVRTMAAEHHTAIRDVRRLLNQWDFNNVIDERNIRRVRQFDRTDPGRPGERR